MTLFPLGVKVYLTFVRFKVRDSFSTRQASYLTLVRFMISLIGSNDHREMKAAGPRRLVELEVDYAGEPVTIRIRCVYSLLLKWLSQWC